MGKQNRSKPSGSASSARPAPYKKKAKVDVKFEGSSGPSTTPVAGSKVGKSQANGKGKGKESASAKGKSASGSTSKTVPAPVLVVSAPKDKGKSRAVDVLPSTPSLATGSFIIIAGTYEKLLYGIEGTYPPSGESEKPTLEPIFIFPAHLACVKAVAASPGGKWLATGSEDEFVKVWDLRRRKEVGSLSQHTGSITSVHFPTASHLITTSVDSTLSLFRTSDWALLKTLKGHSGRVNHVDVHPTGRVALSVGKDMTLKMWDLMRGRGAASLPLGSEAEMVKFSQSGTHFAVLFPRKIQIYSLTLKLLHTLNTTSRFNTVLFASVPTGADEEERELLCVGTEKGIVEVYTIQVGADEPADESDEDEDVEDEAGEGGNGAVVDKIATLVGHTNRIKAISALPFAAPSAGGQLRKTTLLTTVSSDGLINLYDLTSVSSGSAASKDDKIEAIASYDTKGSRITCVYLADGQDSTKVSQKKTAMPEAEDDEDEDSEGEEEEDIYESGEGEDESEDDDMAVEFEDEEEEEEEEEEGEYED
ncbi:hypothetical protein IAU60_000382 [Kwoniella sp. DSM 27419]